MTFIKFYVFFFIKIFTLIHSFIRNRFGRRQKFFLILWYYWNRYFWIEFILTKKILQNTSKKLHSYLCLTWKTIFWFRDIFADCHMRRWVGGWIVEVWFVVWIKPGSLQSFWHHWRNQRRVAEETRVCSQEGIRWNVPLMLLLLNCQSQLSRQKHWTESQRPKSVIWCWRWIKLFFWFSSLIIT